MNFSQKNHVTNVIFLILPAIVCSALIVAATLLLHSALQKNSYYRALMSDCRMLATESEQPVIKETEFEEGSAFNTGFPVIPYGAEWATLNIDGWQKKDIPVFFGDGREYIAKGAGLWIGSRFCGQNAKVVLSAHVTKDFYELEDVKPGTLVTMETVYGKYVYRVREVGPFAITETDRLMDHGEGDKLFMYTCYSREDYSLWKTTRYGVMCDLVEGKEYEAYLD